MHPGLEWLREEPGGPQWLRRLPELVEDCRQEWSLALEEPYRYALTALTVPAGDVVLKLQFPHRENEHEAEALRLWDGDGAIRLLAHDRERHALLLERCRPGAPLTDIGLEAALDVVVGLFPRIAKPAGGPFRTLTEEAVWWADGLEEKWERAGRPFERPLLDAALAALRELPPAQGEQVLVHQDFHAGNVLAAEREPWLVIDPKPLAGEREFGVVAMVRGAELGHDESSVLRRLDRLTTELGLDRDRVRRWTIAQTIAWAGLGGTVHPDRVQVARWLLQAE